MSQGGTTPGARSGALSRIRDALPVAILALSVPVTLAWIGGLTFVSYEAVSWLVGVVGG